MIRPDFTSTVKALRFTDPRFDWVYPTADEAEVADVLEEIAELHRGAADEPDASGHYGTCIGCRAPWPCPSWQYGEDLAVQWLGEGAARYIAHAHDAL